MPWESRKGRGAYFTRSRKVNGRVVREYGGTGWAGEDLELIDKMERLDRDRAQMNDRWAIQDAQEVMDLLQVYSVLVEHLTRAALQSAGYHQHHRGEWRKRRGQSEAGHAPSDTGHDGMGNGSH